MLPTVSVTADNLDTEHICCSISEKKGETCVALKKAWMLERFRDGLVFRKLAARGKAFIEYIPAESAWLPLEAPGCLHINCLWVSGQLKGQGTADRLLRECLDEAKARGMSGVTALSSARKRPFLSDGGYLKHKGFRMVDEAAPFFELLYLPLSLSAPEPRFNDCAKNAVCNEPGLVLYYSNQCPFAEKYAIFLKDAAERRGIRPALRKLTSLEQARNAPCPFTAYSLFHNGSLVTHEILSEKKIEAFLSGIAEAG